MTDWKILIFPHCAVVIYFAISLGHLLLKAVEISFRTCWACNQLFKTVLGRRQHQKNRRNPACWRDGIKRDVAEKRNIAKKHVEEWATKNLPQTHESVYKANTTSAYTPMAKQICLNVYQSFRDRGLTLQEVHRFHFCSNPLFIQSKF